MPAATLQRRPGRARPASAPPGSRKAQAPIRGIATRVHPSSCSQEASKSSLQTQPLAVQSLPNEIHPEKSVSNAGTAAGGPDAAAGLLLSDRIVSTCPLEKDPPQAAQGEHEHVLQDVKEALGLPVPSLKRAASLGAFGRPPLSASASRPAPSVESASSSTAMPKGGVTSSSKPASSTPEESEATVGSCSSLLKWSRASKEYLHKYRLKQEARDRARTAGSEYIESEMTYKYLRHMGEANAWAEELGLTTRYRPHRSRSNRGSSATDEVVCHIYEEEKFSKEVPMKFFERRYMALQSRWNQLAVTKADREEQPGLIALTQSADSGSKPPPSVLSREAQETLQSQIRRVTLETLTLADRMRQQVDVFEKQEPSLLNRFIIH